MSLTADPVEPTTEDRATSLWDRRHRLTTIGMLTLITIAAFEHMGVGTAMPRMMQDLHGAELYSWPFTTFLAASVLATVLSGRLCDKFGPAAALLAGPGLFLVGLLVAGMAAGVPALLAGRALQGLGLGTMTVAIYVLVALIYPERSRPAAFGLIAAAWVVPSLVGPTAAGLLTEHVGWRWVFLGITPFAVLGVLLLAPTVRHLPAPDRSEPSVSPRPLRPAGGRGGGPTPNQRRGVLLAAVATAFGITALSWAAQHPSLGTLWLGLAGLAAIVPALRVLVPRGTFTARPGLPVTILARGLFAGAFFGVEAYVPLTLTAVHGYSPAMSGVPLTIGAIGWAAASHWQGRHPDISRPMLIRIGSVLLAVALAGMALIGPSWTPGWLAVPFWLLAGAAMGVSFPSISVLTLSYAAPRDRGFATSALQVNDMVFAATMIGLGGVMLTTLASAAAPTAAVIPLNLLMAGLALVGAVVFRPIRDRS